MFFLVWQRLNQGRFG